MYFSRGNAVNICIQVLSVSCDFKKSEHVSYASVVIEATVRGKICYPNLPKVLHIFPSNHCSWCITAGSTDGITVALLRKYSTALPHHVHKVCWRRW